MPKRVELFVDAVISTPATGVPALSLAANNFTPPWQIISSLKLEYGGMGMGRGGIVSAPSFWFSIVCARTECVSHTEYAYLEGSFWKSTCTSFQ